MKISIIGAGNMAHQLGKALYEASHDIVEIYNRNYKRGATLATKLNAKSVKKIDELNEGIDLIIIAVSDDAISSVSRRLTGDKWKDVMTVHTSGSVPSTVLEGHPSYGVFYPFQSMTIGQKIVFNEVPILVHSNLEKRADRLVELGESISHKVYRVSDEQRGVIHVTGVFANNFSNHMIALASGMLVKNQLSIDILKPLIVNTLQKILEMDPVDAQTGPAVRRDHKVMDAHLALLSDQPKLNTLYQLISESIIDLDESKGQSEA